MSFYDKIKAINSSTVEMPPLKEYYPSLSSLDENQKKFYIYWKNEFLKGSPKLADKSYIFIYIYELIEKAQASESARQLLHKIKDTYEEEVGLYVSGWLSEVYLMNKEYEKAYEMLLLCNHKSYSKYFLNRLFNLKVNLKKKIDAENVISIAKSLGFYETVKFKKHRDRAIEYIDKKIQEDNFANILEELSSAPGIVSIEEYLLNGIPSNSHPSIQLIDFSANHDFVEKCIILTKEADNFIQEYYGPKKYEKRSLEYNKKVTRSLWDLKILEVFKNPNPIKTGGCLHEYLRLNNHWVAYRNYTCIKCNESFMCNCEKERLLNVRPYQAGEKWIVGICPYCRGIDDVSMITDSKLMYGSTFYAMRWREIAFERDNLQIEKRLGVIEKNEAENRVRERYGVPLVGEGWISETQLYKNLKDLFFEYEVVHHARPVWLKPQHLDVYIPELNIAFEYQGKQHTEPIEFFGGKEAFEKNKVRDKKKAQLCKENNTELFYIHAGEDFSTPTLKKVLKIYLSTKD